MAIVSVVVHPKGATHKDHIGYFLKQTVNGWMFWCFITKQWCKECLTDVQHFPLR